MPNVQVVNKNINELIPYENNPRIHTKQSIEGIANSIKEFGFRKPIMLDKNNVIIAGHGRYEASLLLGLDKVPCIYADDLTPEQVKAFRLVDNKVSEFSSWENEKLDMELKDIPNIDMTAFDFDVPEIDDVAEEIDKVLKENERVRTITAYNLDGFDVNRCAGFYQMPILKPCKYIPKHLIGFNYLLNKKPVKDTGIHFYIDDYQFERVWTNPLQYLDKLAEWDCVLTPDFSLYLDMPMAMKIWNVYRSRLIGQLLQNMGVNVIPTLSWAEKETFNFCFDGIEPGGTVSVSAIGVKRNKEAKALFVAGLTEAIKRIQPSCIVVYGCEIEFEYPCKVVYISNAVTDKFKKEK